LLDHQHSQASDMTTELDKFSSFGASGQNGDLGYKGFDFLLPTLFQRTLDAGHLYLSLGDFDQALFLQDLVHDRDDAPPLSHLLFGGQAPGLLIRLWRGLGNQEGVLRSGWQLGLLQETPHAPDGLTHTSRGTEQVQVGRGHLLWPRFSDVMDVDSDPLGSHLLLELLCDHGSISILRSMKIFDLHGEKYKGELDICQRQGEIRERRQEDIP
jgi:hypothetical protein